MFPFCKTPKYWLFAPLFFLISTNFVAGQYKNKGDTVHGDCYEIPGHPDQWIRLALYPDTFRLGNLQEGTIRATVSDIFPKTSTGFYVSVQRWKNGKWTRVKGPTGQAHNDLGKMLGGGTSLFL